MLDQDDPIILIFKGENINEETPEPENIKIQDSLENKIKENNLNKDIDLVKKEDNSKIKNISENKSEIIPEKKQEKNIRKTEEEKVKKIDEFFPKNLSPLDFVNYIEVQRINGTIMKDMQNFILENHMKKNNLYEVLETKTLSQINNEISDIDIKLFFSKKDLLLFYTGNGNILTFSSKKQNFLNKIIPKNAKNSSINCLDITEDLNELICGYQDGTIEIINLQGGETKYTNNKIHKGTSCIEIKNFKKEKSEISFISSGHDGNVYYNTVKIGLTSILWRIKSTPILTKISENPIYLIKIFDNYLNLGEKYVILGSIDEISIYCIEPCIEYLFSFKKPDYINGNVVPDSHVGIGKISLNDYSDDNKDNILLIISWANIIYFYAIETNEQKIINYYKEIGNFINENEILRIGFINYSVIYIVDNTFSIKLIDTQKINKGKIIVQKADQRPIKPEKNYLAVIEQNHFISPFLFSQLKIFDSEKNKIKTYLYSILENNFENNLSLYILGSKQVYNIILSDWKNYLNNFMKREDYLNLFSIGIKLYKNNFHALSNIPNYEKDRGASQKKVREYLRQIISQYVLINIDEKNNLESISQSIKLVIEFCIEIEDVEYLLNSIEPIFEEKKYIHLFLEKLTPFVLRDKIDKIFLPIDIMKNLFDLYYRNGMGDNLSHMLLHMNIKSLDNIPIKTKMEELNLITPLIYLYINGENQDYIIPLQKMFNYYKKAKSYNAFLSDDESNEIDYGTALNNNKDYLNLNKILESKEYNGHRILWYIRWILMGKKFPYEEKNIEKNIFDELVPKITYWLLNDKVIEELLKFDPKNYFIMHKNIFSSKNSYNLLIKTSNNPKTKISILASLFNDVYKLNDIHPLSLIDYMVAWSKYLNDDKIYFFLYDFIISISKVDSIKKDIKIESACFILKKYNEIVKPINKLNVEYLNIKIMDFLSDKNTLSERDYKKILESIRDNTFDEVKLFLYNQLEDFKRSIEFLLEKESNLKNKVERLYKFLFKKTEELKETNKYEKLIEIIKNNIVKLAKISLKDFYELFKRLFWAEKREIIKKLYEDKLLQYNFVEIIIQSLIKVDEDNENIIDIENENEEDIKYLLGLQIKLLCDLKKFDEIVPALKSSSYYPLKECFNYCKEAGAYEACIYLYLKEANYEQALKLSSKKLEEVFNKLIENINKENNLEKQKELLIDFDKYLNDAKNICENNYVEDLWFELLTILYSYEKKSESAMSKNQSHEKDVSFKSLYQKIIQEIKDLMEKMSTYVSINRIIEVVSEKNKNAGFKEFRELLIKILNNYDNLSNILLSARRLLTNLVLENENSFQVLNLRGELLMIDRCDKCQKKIDINSNNKGEILAFLCNHCFHKTCVPLKKVYECPLCRELEIGELASIGKSLVNKNTAIIEEVENDSNQVQVNVNYSERKMIIRLNKFDNKFFSNRKMLTDSIDE